MAFYTNLKHIFRRLPLYFKQFFIILRKIKK